MGSCVYTLSYLYIGLVGLAQQILSPSVKSIFLNKLHAKVM